MISGSNFRMSKKKFNNTRMVEQLSITKTMVVSERRINIRKLEQKLDDTNISLNTSNRQNFLEVSNSNSGILEQKMNDISISILSSIFNSSYLPNSDLHSMMLTCKDRIAGMFCVSIACSRSSCVGCR